MTKIIVIQSGDNTQTQLQEIKPQSFNTIKIIKSTSARPNPALPPLLLPFLLILIISFHLLYIYYNKFFNKNQFKKKRFRTYLVSERRKPTVLKPPVRRSESYDQKFKENFSTGWGTSPSFPKAFQRIRDLSRTRLVIIRAGWWDLLTAGPAII